jgi:hypothetical protein
MFFACAIRCYTTYRLEKQEVILMENNGQCTLIKYTNGLPLRKEYNCCTTDESKIIAKKDIRFIEHLG